MKHAILGAGAIGGLMATAMGADGEQVQLIVRPEKVAGYPRELVLEQPGCTIKAEAHPVASLSERVDVLWIATKTYQLEASLDLVQATPAMIIPLLNGVDTSPCCARAFLLTL